MSDRLTRKTILVSGAGSGIGQACVERFIEEGATVLGMDNRPETLDQFAGAGEQFYRLICDVRKEADVAAAIREGIAERGSIHGALLAAGTGGGAPIHELDDETFRQVMDVNLFGVFYCVKHLAAHMIESGVPGSIAAIASLNAVQVAEGFTAYCASKAAVAITMQSAALELGRYGIRANSIAPGLVETPLSAGLWEDEAIRTAFEHESPMGRYSKPAEIAGLATYLMTDESSFLTGDTILIDGGQHLKKYPEMFALRS